MKTSRAGKRAGIRRPSPEGAARAVRSRAPSRPRKPTGVTWQIARELAFGLPGMEDGMSYGTPSLKVRGKFMARLKEDGETLAVKVDYPMREALMQAEPETFFITDHYRNYPAVLVRLAKVDRRRLHEVLEHAWRFVAPAGLRKVPAGTAKGAPNNARKRIR